MARHSEAKLFNFSLAIPCEMGHGAKHIGYMYLGWAANACKASTAPLRMMHTLNPEMWIEIRHFHHDHRSKSFVVFTPVLDPALTPLLIAAVTQKQK